MLSLLPTDAINTTQFKPLNQSFIRISFYSLNHSSIIFPTLLIIPKENLDRQPRIPTDLKPILQPIQLLNLLILQRPPINLKVRINPRLADRLGNDTPPLLNTPHQEHLLRGLALLLGEGQQGGVLVQRGVGGAQAGVAGGVDALGGVVGD